MMRVLSIRNLTKLLCGLTLVSFLMPPQGAWSNSVENIWLEGINRFRVLMETSEDQPLPSAEVVIPPPLEPAIHPEASLSSLLVDPGHGGIDFGTKEKKIYEKTINLAVSLLLAEELRKQQIGQVYLTRDSDVAVSLQERSRKAKEKKADLFVSIHVNAVRHKRDRSASGPRVYHLSRHALSSNYERNWSCHDKKNTSRNVGEAEANTTMEIEGHLSSENLEMPSLPRRMELVTQGDSLAHEIAGALRVGIPARSVPVLQANFFVLRCTDAPTVLVEIGFLTNSIEAKKLQDPQYQKRLAVSLASGIKNYLSEKAAPTIPAAPDSLVKVPQDSLPGSDSR
ncbi:MAG: N-acetylmuramoyl-L-alanine amidase [Elusimicrobia bacterium]|nr:N-acetylmuramoyl-L-alanine amidase [Elusimicrobiota bacterium]